jgi:predicted dienelactone hydrolase
MARKVWRTPVFLGLGLLVLIGISVVLQLNIPEPTGPFPAGRTSHVWVDNSRPEALTEDPGDFRNVPVEIWYPAAESSGTKSPYFPDLERVAQNLAASGEVSPLEVFGLRFIKSHEIQNAAIANESSVFPVVILSPGQGTNVEFYAGIADELASHGYIVVGINHPYDVAAVTLIDGKVAQFNPGPFEMQAHQDWVEKRVEERKADILFTIEELARSYDNGEDLLAGNLDLKQVAVMGHSLGGIAAAEACQAESRFLACLNLDGIQPGGAFSVHKNAPPPDQPFMMITKERELPEQFMAQFKAIPSRGYRIVIREASHDSFTDGPLLLPSLLPLPNEADQIHSLIRAYTLAFLDQILKQQPSPLLEKPFENKQVLLEVYPSN